ncbi:hypothetical protein Hdeb2414_s0044g00742951 [Helianthus debilis subsp. tardiflorus]
MMYKSFKHQKSLLSTYTLSPKLNVDTQTRHKLGFQISKQFKTPLPCSPSLSGDSGTISPDLLPSFWRFKNDFTRSMKFQQIDEDSDLLVPFSGFYWRFATFVKGHGLKTRSGEE